MELLIVNANPVSVDLVWKLTGIMLTMNGISLLIDSAVHWACSANIAFTSDTLFEVMQQYIETQIFSLLISFCIV